ncbi:MAG: DUF1801 domain-containing protein [Saprospiraceae bacterium]|nr:DUF1801 domain-containing protein [Saprospiraceae bacterium]
MTPNSAKNIEDYIACFPADIQAMLEQIRGTIKEVAPAAEEAIKYAIPSFVLKGSNLVHFAAFKNHIGFYPAPTGIEFFQKELSTFKQGKGSVQFPLDQPMPLALITKIVKFNMLRNDEKTTKRK